MRKIKFKAKILNSDEWVNGYYVKTYRGHKVQHLIYTGVWETYGNKYVEIDQNTICQYANLIDSQDHDIYEYDVVKTKDGSLCVVLFANGGFQFYYYNGSRNMIVDTTQMMILKSVFDSKEYFEMFKSVFVSELAII